jgi:hypothetical protein
MALKHGVGMLRIRTAEEKSALRLRSRLDQLPSFQPFRPSIQTSREQLEPKRRKARLEFLNGLINLAERFESPEWRAYALGIVAGAAGDEHRTELFSKAAKTLMASERGTRRLVVEKILAASGRQAQREFLAAWKEIDRVAVKDYNPRRTLGLRGRQNKETSTGKRIEGELLQSNKKRFRILSQAEIDAVLGHGRTHAWNRRTERGFPYHTDVFEYVRDTYGDWMPGITQELLFKADHSIERSYKTKKSVSGLPQWLFIPAGAQARDLLEADPRRSAWREIERQRHRERRATRSRIEFGKS